VGFDPHPLANGTPGWKDARGRVDGLKEKLLGCKRRVKDWKTEMLSIPITS
jgi:hypothetical protein